jgi:hypothetical protein
LDNIREKVKEDLQKVLTDLLQIKTSDFENHKNIVLWRLQENLEYISFFLSVKYGLMDYIPEDELENQNKDFISTITKLITEAIEAIDADDIKKSYEKIKKSVKILNNI